MKTDYGASCGRCGQDFPFVTAQDRRDWLAEHDGDHLDFISFFRYSVRQEQP